MGDPVTKEMFRALVHRAGGVDATAAVLEARWGIGHAGTVSRMCNGSIGVTVDAVVAVEDVLNHAPISKRLFGRLASLTGRATTMRELGAQSAAAAGAAHASMIEALADGVLTRTEAAEIAAQFRNLREVIDQIVTEAESVVASPE